VVLSQQQSFGTLSEDGDDDEELMTQYYDGKSQMNDCSQMYELEE